MRDCLNFGRKKNEIGFGKENSLNEKLFCFVEGLFIISIFIIIISGRNNLENIFGFFFVFLIQQIY